MKRWRVATFGLGVYVLALIATAPATLIDAGLQRAGAGRLRLTEARGTLWSGIGQLEIHTANGRVGVAGQIAWDVDAASLLYGQLVYEVELAQASRRFPLTLSVSRLQLADTDISLPAMELGLGVPRLAPLGLTGDVVIHVPMLTMTRTGMEGSATVQLRGVASKLTPVAPLGDYEVRLDGKGKVVNALLLTLNGPLQLDGKGTWIDGGSAAFAVMASVPALQRPQLAPMLRLIAVERGAGRFELQF